MLPIFVAVGFHHHSAGDGASCLSPNQSNSRLEILFHRAILTGMTTPNDSDALKMPCEQCVDLCKSFRISLPDELRQVLRVAHDFVERGILEPLPQDSPFTDPYEKVSPDGPWDDLVYLRFKCLHCQRTFQLSCDTYHGGGHWKPKN